MVIFESGTRPRFDEGVVTSTQTSAKNLDVGTPLCFYLCRPYFDLGPITVDSPLHAYEPHLAAKRLETGNFQRPGPIMHMPPAFRSMLIHESGMDGYEAITPLQLSPELRTEHWWQLCEYLERYSNLKIHKKIPVLQTLVALTYHELALQLIGWPPSTGEIRASPEAAIVANLFGYLRFAIARRVQSIPDEVLIVAEQGPIGSLPRLSAQMLLVEICGRYLGERERCRDWLVKVDAELDRLKEPLLPSDLVRLRVAHLMLRAQYESPTRADRPFEILEEAIRVLQDTQAEDSWAGLLLREATRRILDCATMMALKKGDLDIAYAKASAAMEVDPNDAKAAFLMGNVLYCQGRIHEALQMYHRGACFGPVGTSESLFMAGRCHELLKELQQALNCYMSAIRFDSLAISPMVALEQCAAKLGLPAVARWVRRRAEAFLLGEYPVATEDRKQLMKLVSIGDNV